MTFLLPRDKTWLVSNLHYQLQCGSVKISIPLRCLWSPHSGGKGAGVLLVAGRLVGVGRYGTARIRPPHATARLSVWSLSELRVLRDGIHQNQVSSHACPRRSCCSASREPMDDLRRSRLDSSRLQDCPRRR